MPLKHKFLVKKLILWSPGMGEKKIIVESVQLQQPLAFFTGRGEDGGPRKSKQTSNFV